jgi:hypothetical protein
MKSARAMPTVLAFLAVMFTSIDAQAAGSADTRYRVDELTTPPAMRQNCLPGYAASAGAISLNDLGVALISAYCYTSIDTQTPNYAQKSGPFIAARWFGSYQLPLTGPECCSFVYNINNRAAFGAENMDTGGFAGVMWSVAGGRERVFDSPACDSIRFSAAVAGGTRYRAGWGLRTDPSLPIPFDTLCLTTRWLFLSQSGVETPGPLNGTPFDMNALDVAVGVVDRSAVSMKAPNGPVRVLHAADDAHSSEATHINDLGQISGRILLNSAPGVSNQCDQSTAVRWARDGSETVLPHLPGAISSRAFGIGYDGETVGDSGAGAYCPYVDLRTDLERAVLWRGTRAIDLNAQIPQSAGVTLIYAASINRLGQILTAGWINSEPLSICPNYLYGPEPGQIAIEPVPCHVIHSFLLTPTGR